MILYKQWLLACNFGTVKIKETMSKVNFYKTDKIIPGLRVPCASFVNLCGKNLNHKGH